MTQALREIYSRMYLIRRAEEKICELYPDNDMKTPMHMSMGQEAAPAAIAVAFGDKSRVISTYRSHAPFLAQTGNVEKFFCELYGKVNGTARGRAGSMHLADHDRGHICSTAIVGAGLPLALGIAFASKYKLEESVAITYFGDGAIEEGGFWETLNAASLMKLPLLMVCEDNEYAVHTKKNERRGFSAINKIIEAFDCEYIFDDSNDAEEIYRKALAAKQVIHEQSRPVFMHIKCLRYLEHVGIRNDLDDEYRFQSDKKFSLESDALNIMQIKLKKFLDSSVIKTIEADIDEEINAAVELAQKSDLPQITELMSGVYFD